MKIIIAGSRSATFMDTLLAILESEQPAVITEVVCGMAEGADLHGAHWATLQGIPVAEFHAAWDDIDAPGAVVKHNRRGKPYNALAGHWRNQQMADYADGCIVAWDGRSTGTLDMVRRAEAGGMWLYVRKFSGIYRKNTVG